MLRSSAFNLLLGLPALAIALGAAACDPLSDCDDRHMCSRGHRAGESAGTADAGAGASVDPEAPACTVFGRAHPGLGGEDVASAAGGAAGRDRARAKPFTALTSEYARVLGSKNQPASLERSAPTFGVPVDRWYLEPVTSAVFMNAAYDVAFEGCLRLTGDIAGGTADAKYGTAPTADSAKTECTDWSRRFWSREASPEEIASCVSVAMETTVETYGPGTSRAVSPKRRWAYACAAVLSATSFVTY